MHTVLTFDSLLVFTGCPTSSVTPLKSNCITHFALRKINFSPFQSSLVDFSSWLEEKVDNFNVCLFVLWNTSHLLYHLYFLCFAEQGQQDRVSVVLKRSSQNYFNDCGLDALVQIVGRRCEFWMHVLLKSSEGYWVREEIYPPFTTTLFKKWNKFKSS